MCPSVADLQQLLRFCLSYGAQYDTKFKSKKSVVVLRNFLTVFVADKGLIAVNKVPHLGLIFKEDLCDDDDDVQRQCCKLYAQANMLTHTISDVHRLYVKTAIFRPYCALNTLLVVLQYSTN